MMVTLYRLPVQPDISLTVQRKENERREHHPAIGIICIPIAGPTRHFSHSAWQGAFQRIVEEEENERREHHPAIGIIFPDRIISEDAPE
jgi:hypothetical protein